jgi:hypothetical protein
LWEQVCGVYLPIVKSRSVTSSLQGSNPRQVITPLFFESICAVYLETTASIFLHIHNLPGPFKCVHTQFETGMLTYPSEADNLICHSDRGSQYLAVQYTERLAEAAIDPSVGSVGESYDNALAESTIALFKTEVINFLGPWKTVGQVEWQTLK